MAKIADLQAKPKPIKVEFGAVTLNVEYKPLSYTVREMEAVTASKDVKQIIETMQRLVHSWDLEDDNGLVDPQDFERMMDIPSHIFTEIIKAATADQKPSGEA